MNGNFADCLTFTLGQEGGWSDNSSDPGGCTMKGITLAVYRAWKNDSSLTCADLQSISSADVSALYQQDYWTPVQGDSLPNGVDLMVWDMAVNAGVGGSAKLLQATLGVTVDGGIGPQTMATVATADPVTLINGLATSQANYYQALPGFPTFGVGWLNRVNARHAAALGMAANNTPTVQVASPVAARVDPAEAPPDDFFTWVKSII